MDKAKTLMVASLILGLIIGFLPIYAIQSDEINSLKNESVTLSNTNQTMKEQIAELQPVQGKYDVLEAELSRLILTSASGGGINLKMMPHPETRELTVELSEVFSFDANHAFCRVDTNHEAFVMPTYKMGDVVMEKNEFFMAMSTTTIEEFKLSKNNDGHNTVTMTGGLDCFTEVAKANMTMGSKEISEYATYKIQAVDAGLGGGAAGDTFEFTVYFDPEVAPINYSIFGPEFTFTGDMIDGEVTIPDRR